MDFSAYTLTGEQAYVIAGLADRRGRVLIQPDADLAHGLAVGPVWVTTEGGPSVKIGVNGDLLEREW